MGYRKICVSLFLAMSLGFVAAGTMEAQKEAAKQNPPVPPVVVNDQAMKNATEKGLQMNVVTNLADQASVEAVLIPEHVARRIFGREVAENYAVIEVIISNRDSAASIVVQSIFLDYSKWLLSGIPDPAEDVPSLLPTQKANHPWQVASVESRLVRGELLDAQQYTKRNWTIRGLTALGSVGAGFAFPFSGDVAKGIAQFNGVLVPSASTLWPDGTVSQINRISDVGFKTNQVIPKQDSDIAVAFFPIDRFLTPTLKKVFLKAPSAFFVAGEMLSDPKMTKEVQSFLVPLIQSINPSVDLKGSGQDPRALVLRATLADCSAAETKLRTTETPSTQWTSAQSCDLKRVIKGLSLNNVHVVVGGVMTVDVAAVPATIRDVTFDGGNTSALWTTVGKDTTGVIDGVYLSGGIPSVVDEKGKAIPGISIKANAEGATDTELPFTLSISACVDVAKLFFVVDKSPDTAGSTASSADSAAAAKSSTKKTSSSVRSMPFEVAPTTPHACSGK